MDLYSKAVEFLKMKKHTCAGNFFNFGLHVSVICSSDDRIFIGCSSGKDESEYNTFLEMKTISQHLYIKKIICVDEYECVYLPSMKFIDYIVNDNEKNSEAFVFVDVSHVRPVYSFIQNKRINTPSYFTLPVQDEWQDNNKEIYENNNMVQDNNINRNETLSDNVQHHNNSGVSSMKNNFISNPQNRKADALKAYATIDFNENFADDFEGGSDVESIVSKPVIVMKKETANTVPKSNTETENEEKYENPVDEKEPSTNKSYDEIRNRKKDDRHSSLPMNDVKKFAAAAKNFFNKPL
jgi:hypothetical protein